MLLFLPHGLDDLIDQAQLLLTRFFAADICDLGELLLQESCDETGERLRRQCPIELARLAVLPLVILNRMLQPPVNDLLVDAGNQTFLFHPRIPPHMK